MIEAWKNNVHSILKMINKEWRNQTHARQAAKAMPTY